MVVWLVQVFPPPDDTDRIIAHWPTTSGDSNRVAVAVAGDVAVVAVVVAADADAVDEREGDNDHADEPHVDVQYDDRNQARKDPKDNTTFLNKLVMREMV
jgi:hypothetical protein